MFPLNHLILFDPLTCPVWDPQLSMLVLIAVQSAMYFIEPLSAVPLYPFLAQFNLSLLLQDRENDNRSEDVVA